jgi:hypothetical protein
VGSNPSTVYKNLVLNINVNSDSSSAFIGFFLW